MTVHWLDQTTLERKNSVLACCRVTGVHSFDVIAKEIHEIHWEFQVENMVVRTTTDNGSNFVKAFK